MCVHRTYNSDSAKEFMKLVAPYYNAIETTKVTFENENVIVYADSLGHIEFFDMGNNSLGSVDFPVSDDPSEKGHQAQYGDAECGVEDGNVCVKLPVYDWHDYYPSCDGESDRWKRIIVRWFRIVFDLNIKEIIILDK